MKQIFNTALIPAKIFIVLLLASVTSCRTAEIAVNDDLKTDTEVYDVKGRQGFRVGQVLSFGDFKTSKVARGWTFSYVIPFLVQFSGAREKLAFQQSDKHGRSADVALVSKFAETDLRVAGDYFSVSMQYKNYFAGSVKLNQAETPWEFIVHHVDGASRSIRNRATAGYIRNGQTRIGIEGISSLEGSNDFITQNSVYGYEFTINNKVVAAVSTINNGKVWIKQGLDENTRLVLASVASGLMLRNQVEEQALSLNE